MNEIEQLEMGIEMDEQAIQVAMDRIEINKQKIKELKENENADNRQYYGNRAVKPTQRHF